MDMHELVGAYALDALSDEERTRSKRTSPRASACQAELASFADVLDALGRRRRGL